MWAKESEDASITTSASVVLDYVSATSIGVRILQELLDMIDVHYDVNTDNDFKFKQLDNQVINLAYTI